MRLHMAARTLLSHFFLLGNSSCWPACAYSLRYGVNLRTRRGFNPNLLLVDWHTWAAQLHLAIDVQPRLDGWLEGDRLEGKWLNCPHSHCWNANSPPRVEKKAPYSVRVTLCAMGKRDLVQ